MSLKKDKEKVIDPVWSKERIAEFMDLLPPAGENADFHRLLRAYQSMRTDDFKTFLEMFVAADCDLNATNRDGQTALSIIASHRKGAPYAEAIEHHLK